MHAAELKNSAAPIDDDASAQRLRGFGPVGLIAIVVVLLGNVLFVPGSALLVLLWAYLSRTPWRELGYVRPKNWVVTILAGIGLGVVFKFVMKAAVMPLLHAPPINQSYHYLAGNSAAIPATLFALVIGAGWGEETVFRSFMFERLGKLLGASSSAKTTIVIITSTLFALAHYANQGVPGVEQAAFTGVAFGTIYAFTGRIFLVMVMHAAFDLTAYAMIYWNWEVRISHLLFR